jgi:hypothetical protein
MNALRFYVVVPSDPVASAIPCTLAQANARASRLKQLGVPAFVEARS